MPAEPHETAALPNPDLVERLSKNSPLNALVDQKTFHAGGAHTYIDHPTLKQSQDECMAWRRPQLEADRVAQGVNLPHRLNRWECEPNVQQ
jgi:hypothetical protein